MKYCPNCRELKTLDNYFRKSKTSLKAGFNTYCKPCHSEINSRRARENRRKVSRNNLLPISR